MNGLSVTILVTVFCVLIAGLFAAIVERTTQRDEARAEVARLEAECNAHAATNAALVAEAALTDPATGTTVRVPLLRVVPAQRTEDDYWLNLMRQTEDKR